MVLSVIISDLNCQILFSSVFDFNPTSLESDYLQNVVRKVKAEFDFNFSVTNPNGNAELNNSALDFETKGVAHVKVNNSFKFVVYHSFCGCLYMLLCDHSDNKLLAYRTLILLIRTLRDILPKIISYTSQFVIRADAVSMVVNALIPSGQLLFLHDQAVQQISKDIQKVLS